jgi:hypothetical protein
MESRPGEAVQARRLKLGRDSPPEQEGDVQPAAARARSRSRSCKGSTRVGLGISQMA